MATVCHCTTKYPEIEALLRLAKPADLGSGMFALPEESWPQVNEQKEEALAQALTKVAKQDAAKALTSLQGIGKGTQCKKKLGVV